MQDKMSDSEESKAAEERAAARTEFEQKSTEELFAASLPGDEDDDSVWERIYVLRMRGTGEVFQIAKSYAQSDNPKARSLGLNVLAQIGAGKPETERPFMAESVSIAISHLRDADEEVVRSAAWALSHLRTTEAIPALIELGNHRDPDVRLAVASCSELSGHAEAIPTIIALMKDEDDEVRDWATFNLGSSEFLDGETWRSPDSTEIRAALHDRLSDTYEDARREAIWGLAKRRDSVGLKLLLEQLESEDWWTGDEMAAEETLAVESGTPVEELCRKLRELL